MNKNESLPNFSQSEQSAEFNEPYSDTTNTWINQALARIALEENIKSPDDEDDTSKNPENKIPKMFESFDEIFEDADKSNDEMVRRFSDKIKYYTKYMFGDNGEINKYSLDTAADLYGECLFYLMHDDDLLKRMFAEKYHHENIPDDISMQELMQNFIKCRIIEEFRSWNGFTEFIKSGQSKIKRNARFSSIISPNADISKLYDYMNSMMHIMHTKNPKIREDGIASRNILSRTLFGDEFAKDLTGEIYFPGYKGLTGKDSVDDTIKTAIRKYLEPIKDDLSLSIRPTWDYSHYDNGPDYDYSIPEDIVVRIIAASKESRDMAMQILENKRDDIQKIVESLDDRNNYRASKRKRLDRQF